MSTRTTYYNLTKPDADEHVLRTVINQNYDAIDLQMHANAEAAKEAAGTSADEHDTTKRYWAGDFCIYQNKLYKATVPALGDFNPADWEQTTIADEFQKKYTWAYYDTATADGTAATLRVQLPTGTNGVFVRIQTKAGAAFAQFGAVVMTNARHGIGDLPDFIQTSDSYGLLKYTREGNFWEGFLTQRTGGPQGSPAVTERIDNFVIDTTDASYIEFRTQTSGAVLPSGSTFAIYTRS